MSDSLGSAFHSVIYQGFSGNWVNWQAFTCKAKAFFDSSILMVLASDGIFSPEAEQDLRFGSLLTVPSLATAVSFCGLRIFLVINQVTFVLLRI